MRGGPARTSPAGSAAGRASPPSQRGGRGHCIKSPRSGLCIYICISFLLRGCLYFFALISISLSAGVSIFSMYSRASGAREHCFIASCRREAETGATTRHHHLSSPPCLSFFCISISLYVVVVCASLSHAVSSPLSPLHLCISLSLLVEGYSFSLLRVHHQCEIVGGSWLFSGFSEKTTRYIAF
jgi:hypothetical protein